jgi:hypothetical protein
VLDEASICIKGGGGAEDENSCGSLFAVDGGLLPGRAIRVMMATEGCSMQTRFLLPAAVLLAGLCGGFAATATKGTDQEIAFAFRQAGTKCTVSRDGTALGQVSGGRRVLKLKKNASALTLDCVAGGRKLQAKLPPIMAKEALAGAVISLSLVAIDMLTGAAWVYPDKVTVDVAAKKVTVPEGWRVE